MSKDKFKLEDLLKLKERGEDGRRARTRTGH